MREFIKRYKSEIKSLRDDKKAYEYAKLLGKSRYLLLVEKFLDEFRVQKDMSLSLKMLEWFNSKNFLKEIFLLLNFEQFVKELDKEFFYSFIYLLSKKDERLKEEFFYKVFIHFSFITDSSKIEINHKDIVLFLLKQQKKRLKESFGEDEKGAFFTIMIDDESYDFRGKSIKTLRKKAYKELFDKVI